MHQPNAGQHGLVHPQPLQHPRSASLIQQRRPDSPHHPQNLQQTTQGPYASPHSSTHSIPQQHQSPYLGSVHGISHHQPAESNFFGAHPSPYSTNSAAGSYASSETADAMATQAAISRQPYPPISSYQTPQSNSPASIHSPQTDAHGRPLYAMPPMTQQMYYNPQYPMHPTSYQHHPSAQHHPSMTSAPGILMSHQPPPQMPQQSMPHQHQPQHHQPPPPPPPSQHHQPQHHPHQQQPGHQQTGPIDAKPPQAALQRPPSVMGTPHGTPQTPAGPGMPGSMPHSSAGPNSSAAPGPIPATTPLVVRQDSSGVQWIAFEYSRDRVKMEYTIRCDVESVNVEELSQDFKTSNCVYPRACVGKDQYKGNRLHYESECNAVGWALAQLNPNLRDKRGLIQRAVDSWRNSNQDPKLRSRRVRRMAKISNRKTNQISTPAMHAQQAGGSSTPGLQPPPGLSSGARRPNIPGQMMHHSDSSEGDHMNAGNEYHAQSAHHPGMPHGQHDLSQQEPRFAQNFYPTYPTHQNVGNSLPSVHDGMDQPMHNRASLLATPATSSAKEDGEEAHRALFGNIPESKQRKFILVDDHQRGTRVRVRVQLDQVKMDDMPDAHLRINAVYPRSYYPRQMRSPTGSPRGRGQWDDFDDLAEGVSGEAPTIGKTLVPVSLMDGSDSELPVPRMTKSKRSKEVALNELGYRMAWGQARTFNGRTIFLQRSLDAYRNKSRSSMITSGQDSRTIAPHFETRPGKQKYLERNKRGKRAETP
ncbi:Hypothetical protein R9X50_00608900 [Acrodontium crateriforme]|uniref:DUF8032 domain-containing protein n=1 Tax=Acrodontium crateriforme TaxID=150365 RepID=A0AAQ3MD16_9PEZI|nr:Hypothetical protein R9X50_00608900 [Acrodontium crateriforme]